MKKKKNRIQVQSKSNALWSAKEKSILIIIGVCFFLVAIGWLGLATKEERAKQNAYKAFIGKEIPDSMVCMVSGEIKHKAIFPVEINDKTFYGCCNSCISKLTYNTGNAQFAFDPISNIKISKADAYIRISPENNRQAMFFESNETYNQYLKSIKN